MTTATKQVSELDIHRLTQSQFDNNTIPADSLALVETDVSATEVGYLSGVSSNIQTQLDGKLTPSDVIDDVAHTTTDKPLSANMGKELQDQITHLKSIGRFLSLWNCSTGLPETDPTTSPYTYNTGDYYIVDTVSSASPAVNYKPTGTSYTTGVASTVVETNTVEKGYIYWYDGNGTWTLMQAEVGTVTDVQVNGTSVVSSGVANIPLGSSSTFGAIKVDNSTITASTGTIKAVSLDGLTATVSELNVMDGITATTTELNYTDGVTSNIQDQLDNKSEITFVDWE